ncbi:hypothetical protein GQ607_001009 [Colletotrichum asianum]|uniref:Uncharacterized protein n=1 Tax=Colletotrichum asianum TaxID=702518 RepID=A0A8H3WQR0_9PEZI|nr:hypothetical protein GQ607_001009 [Colletotrichum asianum]
MKVTPRARRQTGICLTTLAFCTTGVGIERRSLVISGSSSCRSSISALLCLMRLSRVICCRTLFLHRSPTCYGAIDP